jgi:hypothetical protein
MNGIRELPERVFRFIEEGVVCEFATVSQAGVPIDTPTYYFPSEDMATIDLATGLSYPAKAERARRNPKVGLLMEGGADEPVVAMRGMAAVRDADLQRNAVRYIAETGFDRISHGVDWAGARKAVWYWTRIIVEVMPERILWWDNPAATDSSPHVWNAPAGTVFPQSDPKPPGRTSPPSKWREEIWRDSARAAIGRGASAHLTLIDDDGFPMPVRARAVELVEDGLRLVMPPSVPWRGRGRATLTYAGVETFVGEASEDGDAIKLRVERALPVLPGMRDSTQVFRPNDEVYGNLMPRLEEEIRRRGQPIPTIPEDLPAPTRMARLRYARLARMNP